MAGIIGRKKEGAKRNQKKRKNVGERKLKKDLIQKGSQQRENMDSGN